MQRQTLASALLSALSILASACSLSLDTDRQQCTRDSDCARLMEGTTTQRCEQGFCERLTCSTTAECRAMAKDENDAFSSSFCSTQTQSCEPAECDSAGGCNDGQVCNTDLGQCISLNAASCDSSKADRGDADCDHYAGFESYICQSNRCQPPQCEETADCTGVSATAECVSGRCDDVTWGCVGKDDVRESMSMTASLELTVIDLLFSKALPDLRVKACPVQGDPSCNTPLPVTIEYNQETALLTVSGFQKGAPIRLTLEATNQAKVDWYTNRTAIDVNVETAPAIMVPADIGDTLGMQFDPDIVVDLETKGTVIARMYDCKDEPAEGVSIEVSKALIDTKIFYLDSKNSILLDEQETTAAGAAGAANVRAEPIRLTVSRGGQTVTQFDFTPRVQRLTYLSLYPWQY